MSAEIKAVWMQLADTPLLGLTVTLVAWQAATWFWRRTGMIPLLNPVLLSIIMLVLFLSATGIDYRRYFAGAQFIHFLLGPATVALAIPLYRQVHALRRSALAVLVALGFGSVTAAASAVGIGWALGASRSTILSLAPKSATTPIAMGIAREIGGLPSLTAVLVLLTGIIGAMTGPWLLARLKVADPRAQGLAMGVASHGIGTARALQSGEVAGAFSGLAMGLNGLATAILVPFLVRWFLN